MKKINILVLLFLAFLILIASMNVLAVNNKYSIIYQDDLKIVFENEDGERYLLDLYGDLFSIDIEEDELYYITNIFNQNDNSEEYSDNYSNAGSNNYNPAESNKSNVKIDTNIETYEDNDLYGYINHATGISTKPLLKKAWPFIQGFSCGMLESNGFYVICLLDTEFNLVWTSFDIVDTVPEIGEYENVSAKDFDAMVNSIVNSMQGVSDNDISLYYKNLSYVQNQYLQMLYQYDNEEGRELWEYLEEALELSENVAEQKLIQYNQYYNTQIKIQNYFQKRVNLWTPSY